MWNDGVAMASKVFFVAALALAAIAGSYGQTVLGSYAEVREALVNGHAFIAAVVDLSECSAHPEGGAENSTYPIYTDQFNEWRVVESTDGSFQSYIFNEQYYLQGDGYWIISEILLMDDDTTFIEVLVVNGLNFATEQTLVWQCEMGAGASYITRGEELAQMDGFTDYQAIKSALILGRHIFATVTVSQDGCDPAPNGAAITGGFFIDDWEVTRDGTEDEVLTIVYPWRITQNPGNGGEYAIETALATIRPNGRVRIRNALLDALEWDNEAADDEYDCDLGTSLTLFAPHDDIIENTYQTYEEVRDALFTAHELEVIIFGHYCNWNIEEGSRTELIYGHRFYNWEWEGDYNSPGPQSFIRFEDVLISTDASIIDEDFRLLEDGTLVVDTVVVDIRSGRTEQFRAVCPLGTGAIFHAGTREATALDSFEAVETAILSGKPLQWEAYLPNCTQGSNFEPGYIGGTFLQTYDMSDGDDKMFYAPATSIHRSDFFDGQLFWSSTSVTISESTEVVGIYPALFDAATWENIVPADLYWECQLGESAWFWA